MPADALGWQPRAKALLLLHLNPVSRERRRLQFYTVRVRFAEMLFFKLLPAACIRVSGGNVRVAERRLGRRITIFLGGISRRENLFS